MRAAYTHNHQSDVITGITVASYCLGALTGCVINFFVGDIFGRRRMIWGAMGLILVGASLQASAYTLAHLIIGRIITGFGTGIDSSTVPMYQSELSKKEWRGRLVSWEIWFIGMSTFTTTSATSDPISQVSVSSAPTGSTSASPTSTAPLHGALQSPSSSSSLLSSSSSSGAVLNHLDG